MRLAIRRIAESGSDALARLITQEMGKTLGEAQAEVADNADMDEYISLVKEANEPEVHGGSVIVRHAHGVVSICAPWNYPVEEIVLLSIPALIAGNAIVVKPSEVVPLSGEFVVSAIMGGLNDRFPGLVSLLQGDGDVGSYLVQHPDVHMAAFTGLTATGAKILQVASASLKRVVLECGGKDPMVVMGDADLDAAAKDAVDFSLANCGQVCCAVERVYVASEVRWDASRTGRRTRAATPPTTHSSLYRSPTPSRRRSSSTRRRTRRSTDWRRRTCPSTAGDRSDGSRRSGRLSTRSSPRRPPEKVLFEARCRRSRKRTFYPPTVLGSATRCEGHHAGGDPARRRAVDLRRHRRHRRPPRQRLDLRPHRLHLLGRPRARRPRRRPNLGGSGRHQHQPAERRAIDPLALLRPQALGLRIALGPRRLAPILDAEDADLYGEAGGDRPARPGAALVAVGEGGEVVGARGGDRPAE